MMEITEGQLTFSFPDEWEVVKYDDTNFYRKKVDKCKETKAVDILALSDSSLWIIEVKDFRGHRIENKDRIVNHELAEEVAQKVRDTVSGLYGAYRSSAEQLSCFCTHMFPNNDRRIQVILFLEEDRPADQHKRFKQVRSSIKAKIEQQLSYLNVRCNVLNIQELSPQLGWSAA
jgi:hypothetical protein